MKKVLLLAFLFLTTPKTPFLKYDRWTSLKIAEPSGICVTADQHYFIASNNGVLCEIDRDGKAVEIGKTGNGYRRYMRCWDGFVCNGREPTPYLRS